MKISTEEVKKTGRIYSIIWEKSKLRLPHGGWHFTKMQEVIPESIVRGSAGIEIGSGCGYDTYIMAKNNPAVKIVSMDISDGVFQAKKLTCGLKNVNIIKGSVLNIPMADNTFDFAYSFGVLHHISEPENGLKEVLRVLKNRAPAYLYLYEDHSENKAKYLSLRIVNAARQITTRLPPRILYFISLLFSPFVVMLFSFPAMILRSFKATRKLSEFIPFNFGTHLFSLAGDLYDRFGSPIEHRFSKKEVVALLERSDFNNISVKRLESVAGWVVWGYKKND